MSTGYPPPPGPIRFDYQQLPAPLAAARRASVMLWIFGALCSLFGVCISAVAWLAPISMFIEQMRQISPQQAQQFSSPQLQMAIRIGYTVFGAIGLLAAFALLGSAWFVRQGRRAAVITALIGCVPLVLWAVFTTLAGIVALASGLALGAMNVALGILVAGLVGLTISWLFQALGAGEAASQQRLIHQQYWQFMQQQQTGGYGYGAPPPAPPSPPAGEPPAP